MILLCPCVVGEPLKVMWPLAAPAFVQENATHTVALGGTNVKQHRELRRVDSRSSDSQLLAAPQTPPAIVVESASHLKRDRFFAPCMALFPGLVLRNLLKELEIPPYGYEAWLTDLINLAYAFQAP